MKEEAKDKKVHSIQWEDQKINSQLKDKDVKDITGGADSCSNTINSKAKAPDTLTLPPELDRNLTLGIKHGDHHA